MVLSNVMAASDSFLFCFYRKPSGNSFLFSHPGAKHCYWNYKASNRFQIISAGRRDSEDNFFGRPAGFGRQFSGEWFRPVGGIRKTIFGRNERSVAQIKVQVMTINSVQVSSKSELSSGTFDHVKVCSLIFWCGVNLSLKLIDGNKKTERKR